MKKKLNFLFFNPKILSFGFLTSLTVISTGWLSLGLLNQPKVIAQIPQIPLTLSREANETYLSFVQRATNLVTTRLGNNFSQNSSLNQVRIVVIGENNGNVAPVLSVNMSRQQWLNNPNPEPLINYFPDSQFLLGFDTPAPATPQKSPTPTPSPVSQPNPTSSPTATPPAIAPPINNQSPSQNPAPPNEENSPPKGSLYNRFRGTTPPQ